MTDPQLLEAGATTQYWKTGHSYMKRHTHELGALAGFEKSGHYFFNAPIGRGYDDGLVTAIAICIATDRAGDASMADLLVPCRSPMARRPCRPIAVNHQKYEVVDRAIAHFEKLAAEGGTLIGEYPRFGDG